MAVSKFESKVEPSINLENKEVTTVEVAEEDNNVLQAVLRRQADTDTARPSSVENADDYIDQFESEWVPNSDGTANTKLPLVRAVVETKMGEELARPAQFKVGALNNKSAFKEAAAQKTFDFLQVRDDWNEAIDDLYQCSNIYGTSIAVPVVQYRPIVVRKGDKVETFYDTRFPILNWPIGKFWIDERATRISEAIDCVLEDEKDIDACILEAEAENAAMKKAGKPEVWKNLDKLRSGLIEEDNDEGQPKEGREKDKNVSNRLLTRWHYFNKLTDQYIVVVNKALVIRDGESPYMKGEIPPTLFPCHKNPHSLYGTGEAEVLMNTQSEMNTSRDIIYDGMHRWANPDVYINGNMTFDNEDMNKTPGNTITYEGQFAVNTVQVQPMTDAMIGMLRLLNDDIPIFASGVNPRDLLGGPEESARKTKERSEIRNKRIRKQGDYRNYGLKRLMMLTWYNVRTKFPVKDAKQLDGSIGFPEIPVKDSITEVFDAKTFNKKNKKNKSLHGKVNREPQSYIEFIEMKGKKGFFEARPEFISGDFEIMPVTDSTLPVSEQAEQETMRSMIADLVNLQAFVEGPLGQQYNGKAMGDDIFKTYNKDPEMFGNEQQGAVSPAIAKSIDGAPRPNQTPKPEIENMRQQLNTTNVQ